MRDKRKIIQKQTENMDNLKQILINHKLVLKKAFGQNFLTDEVLLDEIVEKSGVTENDTVLEIGCGAGALTRALAKKAKRVIGYEIDNRLKDVLRDSLADFNNVEIVFKDIMKESVDEVEKKIGDKYILVANLPYYITTPIITRFLENGKNLKRMSVMVQEEVAKRLASDNKSSDYGAITVAINLRGNAEIVLNVGREKFTPPPNVDSAVVRIDIEENKFGNVDYKGVRDTVRCAFSSRRKTLCNNLMNGLKFTRAQAEKLITDTGLSLNVRGENLSAEDFIRLTDLIKKEREL